MVPLKPIEASISCIKGVEGSTKMYSDVKFNTSGCSGFYRVEPNLRRLGARLSPKSILLIYLEMIHQALGNMSCDI